MAFKDNPIIDQSSRNSDKSERSLKDLMNLETGFICRPDVPDKGCDFDAELVNDKGATNWRFPIQLKSIETLKLIDKEKYISYPFETSRLGYLMRRPPAMGIIVLYSVEQQECYYEYCDKIYNRLMEERGSDDWLDNETVNIHIPYTNILTVSTVKEIHQTFVNRFEQALIMQSSHGAKYGLPTLSLNSDFQYDFHNIEHIKKFLSEYGMLLLNNYDFDVIYKMIAQIPNAEIYYNKDLLVIAAVTYAETEIHVDSQFFCNKLSKYKLTGQEQLMIDFVILKNKLALGYINTEDFLNDLQKLDTAEIDDLSKITIQINLTHYELPRYKAFQKIPESILQSIDHTFSLIQQSQCNDRTKGLLTLWNCENFSFLITSMGTAKFGELRIRESLGNQIPQEERKQSAIELINLETRFNEIVMAVNKKASLTNDKLVKAYSLSVNVKHFILHQINYFSFEVPVNEMDGFAQRIINKISYAATAYNYFLELNIYKEAYQCLCDMIDIIELATQVHKITAPHDKNELYKVKQQMELEFEMNPRPIVFPQLIANRKNEASESDHNGMPLFKILNDEQITSLARTALVSFKLPEERLTNIISEMKAYRMFHQRCADPNIQILQFKNEYEAKEIYAMPIRFVLRSKSTGLETAPSSDMNSLLSSWGF